MTALTIDLGRTVHGEIVNETSSLPSRMPEQGCMVHVSLGRLVTTDHLDACDPSSCHAALLSTVRGIAAALSASQPASTAAFELLAVCSLCSLHRERGRALILNMLHPAAHS